MLLIMLRVMLLPNFFMEQRRKEIAIWATLMVATSWVTVLALYLQDGGYELAFMYAVCNDCGFIMTSKVLLYILDPMFDMKMMNKAQMQKSIRFTTYALVTLLLVIGIAMSIVSRSEDAAAYNILGFVYFIAFLTGGMIYPGLVYYHGSNLLKQLSFLIVAEGVPAETKYVFSQLNSKIYTARRGAGVFSLVCFVWYAEVIALPILASIPFHYVMTFLIFHTMLLLCFGGLVLIRPKAPGSIGNIDSILMSTNPLSTVAGS